MRVLADTPALGKGSVHAAFEAGAARTFHSLTKEGEGQNELGFYTWVLVSG